jgi:predicted RNA-binding Zn ribbon-like protein
MTKKTRYFLLVSAAILTLGLMTGVVASFLGLPVPVFSSAAGPAELEYVPANAAIVAYADVRDVMNSEFRQRIRKLEPNGRERDEFLQKTGLDIEQDIDTVVAAVLPRTEGASGDSAIVLARGRFDVVRLEGLAREHGGQVEDYRGARLIRHVENSERPSEMALGFIEPGLVAMGTYSAVREAIDTKRGGPNVISNTELMRLVAELGSNNAWAVGRFDALASRADLPSELLSQVPAIAWFSVAGHVNGGVSGLLKAEARDEEAAQNMRDMLRGVVALAKLQAGDRPEMQAMVQSLQLGGSGRTVALSFTLPTEFFEALGALAGARREAAQGLQDAAEGMRDAGEAQREAARKLREAADRLERQHPR